MRVVMICTGNTCRSPMAAALFEDALKRRGVAGVQVLSAGLAAQVGAPASENAVEAMKRRGLDISGHRARRADARSLSGALCVCMTRGHARALQGLYPGARTVVLREIPDPYGGDLSAYLRCADALSDLADKLAAQIQTGGIKA